MKILVIGGTRFAGAHAVQQFHESGAAVTVFHRGLTDHPGLPPVQHVRHPDAAWPITAFPRSLSQDWDIVVHMVAMGERDAKAVVEAFAGRAGRLVLVSSCDVYRAYGRLTRLEVGEPDPVPLTEDAPLRTVFHPYREMAEGLGDWALDYEKVLAEQTVRERRDLPWTILRFPKLYGREDNADLSTVYGFAGVPDWRWTHAHVENAASALVLASRHLDAAGAVFNVGEARTPTMGERLARLPRRADPMPAPPDFDFRQPLVVDTTRIRERLGYRDRVDEAAAVAALAAAA